MGCTSSSDCTKYINYRFVTIESGAKLTLRKARICMACIVAGAAIEIEAAILQPAAMVDQGQC